MAPFGLMAAAVSLLAKSFTGLTWTSAVARCTSAFPSACLSQVKSLSTQASDRPKRPPNGYLRYVLQQQRIVMKEQPEMKFADVIRMLAQQWMNMRPEQKQPFNEAFLQDMQQYNRDIQHYQAQLTPAQLQQQVLDRKQMIVRRRALRRKKELKMLGKPKRPRSSFNIFMAEHFHDAQGATPQLKMKSLLADWRNLLDHQRQVYTQLAEDDKIRHKNELKSWKDHMLEIGRNDLIRDGTKPARVKRPAKGAAVKKD